MTTSPNPVERAIKMIGSSEADLARATGLSQPLIHKAKASGKIGPRLAIAIHRVTHGAIPGSEMRPDLWRTPESVPVEDGAQ